MKVEMNSAAPEIYNHFTTAFCYLSFASTHFRKKHTFSNKLIASFVKGVAKYRENTQTLTPFHCISPLPLLSPFLSFPFFPPSPRRRNKQNVVDFTSGANSKTN